MASRAGFALFFAAAVLCSQEQMPQPRYTAKNELIRPEGYREWMFAGSNLGMGYSEGTAPKNPAFHNIYIQREAYRQYVETGAFPEKTMLVMEQVAAASNASINRQGQFGDRFIGIEVALKDSERFPDKWAYFNFTGAGGKPLPQARAFPKEACWNCHHEHGAVDNVFVQFYPVLREARAKR